MTPERAAPHMEIPSMCLAFAAAPFAYLAIGFIQGFGLILAVPALDLSWRLPDEDVGPELIFLLAGVGMVWAYPAGFRLGLPIAIWLRATGRLSFWTVVPPTAAVPITGSAALAFSIWLTQGASPLPIAVWFWFLFVPGTTATAIAFWALYCFFTGQRFFARPKA